ncbi:hypothetical protein [Achromobacter sp. E1]|uniref:hypothetical protein n=1 Tax=Achromobacter sp. E1 TaxID=3141581 RepID=UPI0030D1F24D
MKSQQVWWEKTVEYKFVLDAERKRGLQFAAPLSGVHERAGDGVFSSDSKIALVEFKRSEAELETERDKFADYEEASELLMAKDGHHFLVYGSYFDPELRLNACTYFSRNTVASPLDLLNFGLESVKFNEYLADLLALKKVDGRSSGTVAPESVASVIGVTREGVSATSLSEYIRIAMPYLYQAPTPSQTYQPPTPGYG